MFKPYHFYIVQWIDALGKIFYTLLFCAFIYVNTRVKPRLLKELVFMEIGLHQQIFNLIKKSNRTVIVLPKNPTIDGFSAALALRLFLLKLNKESEVVSLSKAPEALSFLPGISEIKQDISSYDGLVIELNTASRGLDELSYQTEDGKLKIFIKAKSGKFSSSDVSFTSSKLPIDCLIFLECQSLEDAGSLLEKHAELFHQTPKINIDHSASNEQFGAVNLVDLSATSVSEVLSGLFKEYEEQMVDEDIATCLLSGIIHKTDSFQHSKTTPNSFIHASNLVSLGGRRQDIVQNLFKTKSFALLKLWGRLLSALKTDEEKSLAYGILSENDFAESGAKISDLSPALEELSANISGYLFLTAFGSDKPGAVRVCVLTKLADKASSFSGIFGKPIKISTTGFGQLYEYELNDRELVQAELDFLKALE